MLTIFTPYREYNAKHACYPTALRTHEDIFRSLLTQHIALNIIWDVDYGYALGGEEGL